MVSAQFVLFGRVVNDSVGESLSFREERNEAEQQQQSCEKWTARSSLVGCS